MEIVQTLSKSHIEGTIEYAYQYNLIRNTIEIEVCGKTIEVQGYGIKAIRTHSNSEGIVFQEEDLVKIISPQRHKVQGLIKLLWDNTVSPVHLIDVLGEYIDEFIGDFDQVDLENVATN